MPSRGNRNRTVTFVSSKRVMHGGNQWSLETWSRSRDSSRDPFLRVSVSEVSGLKTLNIAMKCFIKISILQRFLFLYLQVRNNQNTSEKCLKFGKNSSQMWWRHLFFTFGKMHKFWSLGLGVFLMKARSRSRLEGYGLDYITGGNYNKCYCLVRQKMF